MPILGSFGAGSGRGFGQEIHLLQVHLKVILVEVLQVLDQDLQVQEVVEHLMVDVEQDQILVEMVE
jgi:hypothetical protein